MSGETFWEFISGPSKYERWMGHAIELDGIIRRRRVAELGLLHEYLARLDHEPTGDDVVAYYAEYARIMTDHTHAEECRAWFDCDYPDVTKAFLIGWVVVALPAIYVLTRLLA